MCGRSAEAGNGGIQKSVQSDKTIVGDGCSANRVRELIASLFRKNYGVAAMMRRKASLT